MMMFSSSFVLFIWGFFGGTVLEMRGSSNNTNRDMI